MESDAIESLSGRTSGLEVQDEYKTHEANTGLTDEPPPPAHILSKGVIATDITRHFITATQQLNVGQLVQDEYFTLFESVGAIEIMDPKMDTGFLAEGETMDDDYNIGRDLEAEEVLGIIDELLCLEMAWHMGHPLSQTVFTSLYIDRLLTPNQEKWDSIYFSKKANSLDDELVNLRALRAYCIGLIKTCSHVNNCVKLENFYEEEDFATNTYHRILLDEVEDAEILEFLNCAKDKLSSESTGSQDVTAALCMRLKFRIAFLTTVSVVNQRDIALSREKWDGLLATLPGVSASQGLSKPVPGSFSVKLQRKLASTVPPRPVVSIAFEMAYSHLERLCTDGLALTEVLNYYDSHSLMTFVILFQARKPQPTVYIRTLLQFYIFGDMKVLGCMSIRQLLDDDLASLVLAEDKLLDRGNDDIEVPHDPRFNMAKRMEIFRERAAHSYLDIFRTQCQNRCRTRRDLTHSIADWENLQLDAEELDLELREFTKEEPLLKQSISTEPIYAFPLSSWAYFYKLRQMEWIVQMGFELEVYQANELAGMYWYLAHITHTRIGHLERMRSFTMHALSTSTRKRSTTTIAQDSSLGRALSYLNASLLEAAATQNLAEALSNLYNVLQRHDLLPSTPYPYSDDALRYELRMKPFLPIGLPEVPAHAIFHASVAQSGEASPDLLAYAADCVGRARKDLELLAKLDARTARCRGSEEAWKKNVMGCLRACISASIGVSVMGKAVGRWEGENVREKGKGKGKKRRVEEEDVGFGLGLKVEVPAVGTGYHDWWTVPKIVALK